MLTIKRSVARGDTLVEVLFGVAIFALVAVGAMLIMNQGTAISQRALEVTLVRQQIDAQAETLRFLNASYIEGSSLSDQWVAIQTKAPVGTSSTSVFDYSSGCPTTLPTNSFVLNTQTAAFVDLTTSTFKSASTFSQVNYNSDNSFLSAEGIWIQAVRPDVPAADGKGNADYIDFHIRACWDSPGQSVPESIGTIVRLYEPRG